jgi:hypothetical protein
VCLPVNTQAIRLSCGCREPCLTLGPHVSGRTTRHDGYTISQRKRKLIEQVFGWMQTIGGLRKLRHCGGEQVDWIVTFTAAA